jgi:uncharacterized Zn-binding protein involved in type VI secretion
MAKPAAKLNDLVVALDTHIVLVSSPGGPVPTPMQFPFNGKLLSNLSSNVNIEGKPAATVGSIAQNVPPHIPIGGPFQKPPSNTGTVITGSSSVFINGKMAARVGDTALTCNDPSDLPLGKIQVMGLCKVFIGG